MWYLPRYEGFAQLPERHLGVAEAMDEVVGTNPLRTRRTTVTAGEAANAFAVKGRSLRRGESRLSESGRRRRAHRSHVLDEHLDRGAAQADPGLPWLSVAPRSAQRVSATVEAMRRFASRWFAQGRWRAVDLVGHGGRTRG